MKKRRTSSRNSGVYFYPSVLFLLFVAAFGSLFYFLYDRSFSFEREKVDRDIHILSSTLQTTLLDNERFFLLKPSRQVGTEGGQILKRQVQRHLATHPEIVSVEARSSADVIQWKILSDSSADLLPRMSVDDNALISYADSSHTALYSKPFRFEKRYYFEARIPVAEKGILSGTFSVVYSAEKLLGAILKNHPMEGYEISLYSGSGQSIASTGFSNVVASLRVQRAVGGYKNLLSVDIANPKYVFWTLEMILAAGLCGVLSVAVFFITFVLRRDIAKLRTAESSLRESEERFRTIFENSADAMRLVDRYSRTVMVNSAYSDLVKISHEELLREYNAGDENLEARYSASSAFRSQFDAGTLKMPTSQIIKRSDGEEIPAEVSHSFISVGKDKKLLLSIFRDVSERKKYELESQQVQKMDALGAFAVGIGNTLKNIVGIVMNSAEVINKEATGNPLLTQYVDMIIRESKRASELADDLLVFARSKRAEEKPILVEKIFHQVQKILEYSIPSSIRLSVSMNDDCAVVKGDIHQLHQAVVNLALTAEHRMPNGGEIKIEAAIADPDFVKQKLSHTEEKEFLIIKVSDTGKELDEYSKRRIFEPFFSAKATDHSTGLRLSVVYGIVQNHRGFIDVRSEKGKGTTFSLFFPVMYHEKAVRQLPAEPPQGGNERILIVDDEESYRQIYKDVLVSYGYTVYAAQDGEEAFALYEKHRSEIDLVVSDLMMPRMNGEELFQKLHALNPSVKVILATGAIDLKAETEFLNLGVRNIIMKPFSLDEVMTAVRKALDAQ